MTHTHTHTRTDAQEDSDHVAPCILTSYEDYTGEDDDEDESNEDCEGQDAGLPQLRTVARRRGAEGAAGPLEFGALEWSVDDRTHACACVLVDVCECIMCV